MTQNQNPDGNSKTKLVLGIVILLAAAIMLYLFFPRGQAGIADPSKARAYYSVDDGATYFADAEEKLAPFDHDGKEAVRAYVYQCDGKPFVAYLERYNKDGLAAEAAKTASPGGRPDARQMSFLMAKGRDVKRPGDAKWINKGAKEAADVIRPRCPSGDGTPVPVTP